MKEPEESTSLHTKREEVGGDFLSQAPTPGGGRLTEVHNSSPEDCFSSTGDLEFKQLWKLTMKTSIFILHAV